MEPTSHFNAPSKRDANSTEGQQDHPHRLRASPHTRRADPTRHEFLTRGSPVESMLAPVSFVVLGRDVSHPVYIPSRIRGWWWWWWCTRVGDVPLGGRFARGQTVEGRRRYGGGGRWGR